MDIEDERGGPLTEPLQHVAHDDRPTLLLVSACDRSTAIATWADRAGLRCLGSIAPEIAGERLAKMAVLDFILLDLRGVDIGTRIDRSTARALTGRFGLPDARLIVIADLAGLDCALAMLEAPETDFLCEPSDSDIIALLVMAGLRKARSSSILLHDAARDSDTARLERLSDEVRRLAATIDRMTMHGSMSAMASEPGSMSFRPADEASSATVREPRGSYRGAATDAGGDPARHFHARDRQKHGQAEQSAAPTHAEIRAIIRARRMRDQYLPADLFADPAWDMMLDLLAAQLAGQRVSVSSLCIAAAVPPTTALRWIRQLTDRAVFARIDDPVDGRRVFIELTEAATQAVLSWAQAIRRTGGLLGSAQR